MNKNYEEQALTRRFQAIINEVTYAVADLTLTQTSPLFKAATEAKKILDNSIENGDTTFYTYPQYKWTQFGMLEHSLQVVKLIIQDKKNFPEACAVRALQVRKTIPSIRQACCRVLGLDSRIWNNMAKGDLNAKSTIIQSLIKKYPSEEQRILHGFNGLK